MSDSASETSEAHGSALRNSNVVYYLIGRFLWVSAVQINNVAVGWLVYDYTRSAWALGFVGLAAFAPRLIVALASGVVADRFDRRRILGVTLTINAVTSLGLLLTVVAPTVLIGAIYALFIVSGTARGFAQPAHHALGANLVPRSQFSRVWSLASSISQSAHIAGPALGGFILLAGPWAPFACAMVFFAVAAATTLMIQPRGEVRAKGPVRLADAFAGLGFIWQRPIILGAMTLDMFSVLLGGVVAILPIIATEVLHVGPAGLGILRSTPALGAVMVGLFLAYRPLYGAAGTKLFVAVGAFGLATVGLGLSTNIYLSLLMLWFIGASDVISVVIRQTVIQSDTPDHMRGRVAAVNSVFIGASNELGEFESGATAAIFGLVPSIVFGGIGTILVALGCAYFFPSLRRRDKLVEDEPKEVAESAPSATSPA